MNLCSSSELPASLARPLASGTHGRCRAGESSTIWCFRPPLALGSGGGGVEHRLLVTRLAVACVGLVLPSSAKTSWPSRGAVAETPSVGASKWKYTTDSTFFYGALHSVLFGPRFSFGGVGTCTVMRLPWHLHGIDRQASAECAAVGAGSLHQYIGHERFESSLAFRWPCRWPGVARPHGPGQA